MATIDLNDFMTEKNALQFLLRLHEKKDDSNCVFLDLGTSIVKLELLPVGRYNSIDTPLDKDNETS